MQDLANLVRVDGAVGGGGGEAVAALRGASIASGETPETHHVTAARGMSLALTALQGLLHHLALLEDSSNNGTFSLTIGKILNNNGHVAHSINVLCAKSKRGCTENAFYTTKSYRLAVVIHINCIQCVPGPRIPTIDPPLYR